MQKNSCTFVEEAQSAGITGALPEDDLSLQYAGPGRNRVLVNAASPKIDAPTHRHPRLVPDDGKGEPASGRAGISLEQHQTAIIRQEPTDFRMEPAFWSAMRQICEQDKIVEDKFVILAKRRRPDLLSTAAVRARVLGYIRNRRATLPPRDSFGGSPTVTPPAAHPGAPIPVALHVLVVDDVAMNRDIAGSFLRAAGHQATCVEGGAEAVAAVGITDFDVVLMDVRMPEMDGLEATRRIRALEGARGLVPIVALTARAFIEQVSECREAGMDSHVPKPFTPDTLLSAVLRAFAAGRSHGENLIADVRTAGGHAPPASPVIGWERLVLDRTVFERTAFFLPPETVDTYVQAIAERAEALLHRLRGSYIPLQSDDELAEAAHTIAGSAGMFGFERLTYLGRRFERAIESGATDTPALVDGLRAALQATIEVIQQRSLVVVE
jgi:CheY-like chemotaxis protein/HPt (histidine-containing phosphotransfer) domain-containing protein